MKKLLLLVAGLCLSMSARSQTATPWTMIWNDEFSGTTLDQTKWTYETGTGVNGDFGTGQLDRATARPENVAIEQGISGADGGALRITTRKETYQDRQYTSGRINTKDKAFWGPNHRIVARVWPKGVKTQGQGFAFWMMGNEHPAGVTELTWPQLGEIDIMEYVGSIPSHNLGTVHYAWQYNNNQYADWNHGSQGGYYSFANQQAPDSPEWLRIDLGAIYSVSRVNLNWENNGKNYNLETSIDGTTWNPVFTTTTGDGGVDDITFAAVDARFVRINGTFRTDDYGYSLFEVQVFAAGGTTNLALNRPATASSTQAADFDLGPALAVDGNTATRWGSGLRNPQYQCCTPASSTDPNVGSNGWHTYGIDWFADRMEFFVDDNVYHIHYFNDGAAFAADGENQAGVQLVNGKRVRKSEFSNLYSEWHPFEHKMYAILSAGVGGSNNTYGGPIATEASFPADVYIDWVRVYSNGVAFNPPPAVTITAPVANAVLTAPATLDITATASDAEGGTITEVAFYAGTTLLGKATTAPYSFSWTNVPAGSYSLTARATDNGGATTTSPAVLVTVKEASTTGDLALGKPATASSSVGNNNAAAAVDGNLKTRWESASDDNQWLYVDLGATYNINQVKITWEAALGRDFVVELGSNTTSWTTLKQVTGNTALVNDFTGLSGSGRYLRILGIKRGTQYGYSIFQLEAYGTQVVTASAASKASETRITGFPNPVATSYQLKNAPEGALVKVVDVTGRVVLRTYVRNSAVDVSALRSGAYMLLIEGKQQLHRLKVYKN
jgi:hypothetical protein